MKGAIFDMDGTLTDSMDYWLRNNADKLSEAGIPYTDDTINKIIPMGIRMGCEYIHQLGHPKTPDVLRQELEDSMVTQYSTNIPMKPFALEYIKKLSKQGVKMCVLSASTHKMIEASARHCGYFEYMKFVMSCEEVGASKSEPSTFIKVAEKLGVPIEDITVFDDNSIAVKSAKKAGAKVCAVYDKSADDYKDEIIAAADKYIYSFEELI